MSFSVCCVFLKSVLRCFRPFPFNFVRCVQVAKWHMRLVERFLPASCFHGTEAFNYDFFPSFQNASVLLSSKSLSGLLVLCGQRARHLRCIETRSPRRSQCGTDGILAVEKNVTAVFGQKEICRNIFIERASEKIHKIDMF